MKRNLIFLFICIECLAFSFASGTEVVGYFASWKWYRRNKLVNPATIDYSKFTIINYAFFKPMPDGSISSGDAYADDILLKGDTVNPSLVELAHRNGVKVTGSIGGGKWSSSFGIISTGNDKCIAFADACVRLIRNYNLDGIDIDWEFPGQNGRGSEKENFTMLIKAVRKALDTETARTGKKYLLTAAVGPAPNHMKAIEWNAVIPLLDHVNLMSYNYHGAWDHISNHHAPLYPSAYGNRQFNIDATITSLVNTYQVPGSKIVMGIPFYGRSVRMQQNTGLHQKTLQVPDAVLFPDEKGTPSYYNIVAQNKNLVKKWDEKAGASYYLGDKSFLSCEDEQSVILKASYVIKNNLAGVFIWDITGDCIETFPGSRKVITPLLDALHSVFSPVIQTQSFIKGIIMPETYAEP